MSIRVYFRAMTPTGNGLPSVGPSKRMLGALPSETDSTDGTFGPGTGGMSVSPDSPWHVPHHRRPRGMGRGSTGAARDWVFGIDNDALYVAALAARLDPITRWWPSQSWKHRRGCTRVVDGCSGDL